MKTKIKSLLVMLAVFAVAVSNLPLLAAVNYLSVVRNTSANEAYIGASEEIEVELGVTGTPPVNVVKPNDVILVLDKSGSMASDNRFAAMKQSAQEFIDLIDFNSHKVGVVDYSSGASTYNLSSDATAVKNYIHNIAMGGGTATDLAIKEAVNVLTANGRPEAQPVILLLTDGAANNYATARAAAQEAKDAGVVFYTIALLGPNDNPDTSAPNILLKEMATTAHHHHFVLGSVGLMDIYRAIVKEIGIASAYDVEIVETVPEEFEIVPGSYEHNIPQPTVDGNTLKWNMLELKANTLKLSYKIKLKDGVAPGKYNITNKTTYKDYTGKKCSYTPSNTTITVKHKAPIVTEVTPAQGYIEGGNSVTITGENFRDGLKVKFKSVEATDVIVVDSQTITVKVPASASSTGKVIVTVTNDDSQKATGEYTYIANPEVTSIDPAVGPFEGGNTIKINGKYLSRSATVTIDGQLATYVSGTEGRQLVVRVPAATREGKVDVVVTNPDGTTVTVQEGYEYLPKKVIPAPEVIAIEPNTVETGKSIMAVIKGTGFQSGLTVKIGGQEAIISSVSETSIKLRVPASDVLGKVDVVVTNPDGQEATLVDGFEYIQPASAAAPKITEITPAEVPVGSTITAYITGENFQSGLTVKIGGQEAQITNFTSSKSLRITVPVSTTVGKVDVVVTNPDGQEAVLVEGFEYLELPAPEITDITVTSVQVGETVLAYINGTGFQKDLTVKIGNQEAEVIRLYSEKRMYIRVPASDVAGVVDVTVTNPDGKQGVLQQGFEYLPEPEKEAPIVTLLTVTSGERIGNNLLYIEGENFQKGLKVYFGNNEATVINVYNTKRMYVRVPAADAPGAVDVKVVNPDGKEGTLVDGYTYNDYVPEITSLTVTSGELEGGELLYINGKNFDENVRIMFGNEEAEIVRRYSEKRLYVRVPASTVAGAVDVKAINGDGATGVLTGGYTYNEPPKEGVPEIIKITTTSSASGTEVSSIAANKLFYLHGANLESTHQVKIVDAAGTEFINAPYRYYTAIKMYVRVPAAAAKGQATLTIINADGTIESNAVTFTIS